MPSNAFDVTSSSLSSLWLARFPHSSETAAGNNTSGKPGLREQLCTTLRQAIRQGQLAYGARLPASRVLAADLRLSRVTVEAAYVQLEAEGYVSRQVGRGTIVSIQIVQRPLGIRPGISLPATQNGAAISQLSQRGTQVYAGGACMDAQTVRAFNAGCPDIRSFPLDIWRSLTSRRLRRDDHALLGYGDPQGYAPLRSAIAHYLNQSRGVRCDAGQVLILTSSQQALQLLAMLLLDTGDTVWMEEPGYRGAKTAFASAGALLQPVAVDADGMNIDTVSRQGGPAPKLIYTTPSHQYPTGVTLSLQRRLALIDFAREHSCWLIEDDYDSEFEYDGQVMPAMQGLDSHGCAIYIGTFSKVLFPSLRLAYLVLPPSLAEPFCQARNIQDGHSAQLMQAVTADFISRGHFAAHLRQMRQLYGSRRNLLMQQLQSKVGDWLYVSPRQGGLQLAALLQEGDETALSQRANAMGISTPGLSTLYLQPPAQTGWLLGYAGLRNEEIVAAVEQLAKLRPF